MKSNKPTKPRPPQPEFLAKLSWSNTAMKIKVRAKDENQAWHRAWGTASRMQGGDSCLKVVILKRIEA